MSVTIEIKSHNHSKKSKLFQKSSQTYDKVESELKSHNDKDRI